MRLTQEQAAVADARALFSESAGVSNIHEARILDLLDQLRDTTTRAEQAEKDAAVLAEIIRIAMGDAPALIQLNPSQQAAINRALASGALQRAKGGAA